MKYEVEQKYQRINNYLQKNNYDALVIGRKDNFSWITFGGSNEVVWDTEYGFCILIITKENKYCIAQVMDGDRIMQEELRDHDYTYIPLKWYEVSPLNKAKQLLEGKKILSDIDLGIGTYNVNEVYDLHFPLFDSEIDRLRILGQEVDEMLYDLAKEVIPGMTEIEVKNRLIAHASKRDMRLSVALVGSDERISNFRHPTPTNKKVENCVLITPSIHKWGLHANIARMIAFGKALQDTKKRYEDACYIGATCMSLCKKGIKHSQVLDMQKELYTQFGYSDEWEKHFQGGLTGYMISNLSRTLDKEATIGDGQAYEWFITITGAKSAELGINIGNKREILSTGYSWPTKTIKVGDQSFRFPVLLVK